MFPRPNVKSKSNLNSESNYKSKSTTSLHKSTSISNFANIFKHSIEEKVQALGGASPGEMTVTGGSPLPFSSGISRALFENGGLGGTGVSDSDYNTDLIKNEYSNSLNGNPSGAGNGYGTIKTNGNGNRNNANANVNSDGIIINGKQNKVRLFSNFQQQQQQQDANNNSYTNNKSLARTVGLGVNMETGSRTTKTTGKGTGTSMSGVEKHPYKNFAKVGKIPSTVSATGVPFAPVAAEPHPYKQFSRK